MLFLTKAIFKKQNKQKTLKPTKQKKNPKQKTTTNNKRKQKNP